MESNRSNKRKGLAKSKMLKSLYRSSAKPKPDSSSTTAGFIIVKQDQVFPHHMPKVAFAAVPGRDTKLDNFYSGSSDEAVDAKAARYISAVQERFRLELINSDDFV
ncbi:hypothetical protein SASPL_149635 [Salvia splendens]|uniref:Uncharacterized protein n=1 Tax=Salvia splendens TaxID=180675 RepID=A0A8X8Z4J7_SALSN|nr:hypothetical protein SASPL_149635 [Salvia splendens]